MTDTLQQLLTYLALGLGACLVIALTGLLLLVRRIRALQIPRHADFFGTLRHVPLLLVVLLDLLDFALDIFSAPLMWVILDRMGLPNLRNKATIEALIPISGPIPTFTICWIAARALNLGDANLMHYVDQYARQRAGGRLPPGARQPTIIDMDDDRRGR